MKKIFIFTLIVICFGCSSPENFDEIQIRISNVSGFNYENIVVNASGENISFGNLNASTKSEYKTFILAYRYAYVEFQIDGETYTIQPIDYVGEEPLKKGKYSYEINVNPNNQSQKVTLELKNEY